jgi:transcriptional regulator with XRE-family HTH domain
MQPPGHDMSSGPVALARRLRELREQRWPDAGLTQATLAEALSGGGSLAVSTISSWESPNSPTIPPRRRLAAYATFFATRKSLEGDSPRVLADKELDESERAERDSLLAELLALREPPEAPAGRPAERPRADLPARATWHFPNGGPVRVICGRLPDNVRSPLASAETLNYVELAMYADLDALVELFGHLRAENPATDVRFKLATELLADDLSGHIVLLGGLGWNQATDWFTRRIDLPVRQVTDPKITDGEVFELIRGRERERFYPVEEGPLGLTEDVGLLVRMRNPINSARTLTICNGVYGRGVLGAVRCLTDQQIRDSNEAYLASRFGDSPNFGVLMRVPVMQRTTLTPDLNDANVRLFEWPERIE